MQCLTRKVPSVVLESSAGWEQVLVNSRGIASARVDAQLIHAKQPIVFAPVLVEALVFFSSRLPCQLGAPVLVGALDFGGGLQT